MQYPPVAQRVITGIQHIWGLFVKAGYLTIEEKDDSYLQIFTLKIPNNELLCEFQSLNVLT